MLKEDAKGIGVHFARQSDIAISVIDSQGNIVHENVAKPATDGESIVRIDHKQGLVAAAQKKVAKGRDGIAVLRAHINGFAVVVVLVTQLEFGNQNAHP